MLAGIRAKGAAAEAVPLLRGIQKTLGRISFVAIILLSCLPVVFELIQAKKEAKEEAAKAAGEGGAAAS